MTTSGCASGEMAVTFHPQPPEQQHCLERIFSLKDPVVIQITNMLFTSQEQEVGGKKRKKNPKT